MKKVLLAVLILGAADVIAQVCFSTSNNGTTTTVTVTSPLTVQTVSLLPGIHGNSNVLTGGGTDDTAAIQLALNTINTQGGGMLIVDKPCLVSGLQVYSNTTIFAVGRGVGFYLANSSGIPIIRNGNPSTGAVTDQNISLIGGTYNFNIANQSGPAVGNGDYYEQGIGFYGVNNVLIKDAVITSGSTGKAMFGYGVMFSNWTNVSIDDVNVYNNRTSGGGDGFHFVTGSNLTIHNVWGFSTSDFVALNSSDYHGISLPSPNWVVTDGPISNFNIDGVNLQSSWNGIGMIAASNSTTNGTIHNLTGQVTQYAISMWNPWGPSYSGGYVDGVIIDDVDLINNSSFSGVQGPILIMYEDSSGTVNARNIQISHVRWHGQTTGSPWALINGGATLSSVQFSDIQINEPTVNTNNRAFLFVASAAAVNHVSINGLDWQRPSGSGTTSHIISNSGTITESSIANVNAPLVNNP